MAQAPLSLVTGSCGFMGTHMVEVLHEAGHRIRATDLESAMAGDDRQAGRFPSVARKLGAEMIPSDMTRPETLAPLVEGVDYVFHIASVFNYTAPWEVLERVNVGGTRSLLDLLVGQKKLKRFVLWGAGGVYGIPSPSDLPLKEDQAPNPPNNYLNSKWRQEFMTMDYGRRQGLPYSIIRPTTVYGPRAVYGGGMLLMSTAKMGVAALPSNFDSRIPFVHVRDVCRAALWLAEHDGGANEIFNLNDDSQLTNIDFFRYVAELMGHKFVELPAVPFEALRPFVKSLAQGLQWFAVNVAHQAPPVEADTVDYLNRDFVYSNEKLKGTGYEFLYPDARDGIRDTIRWYQAEGWI